MQNTQKSHDIPASKDFAAKLRVLRELAAHHGHAGELSAIEWFLGHQGEATVSSSVQEYLPKTLLAGKPTSASSQKNMLAGMMGASKFGGTLAQFVTLSFEEWFNRLPEDVKALIHESRPRWMAPRVRFCQDDVAGSELAEWEKSGVVDQRHMYETREAAAFWTTTRGFKAQTTRHQYSYCKDNLSSTLSRLDASGRHFDEIILLGAGSPDKDFEVIKHFVEKEGPTKVLIVDSSFHMLVETHSELMSDFSHEGIADLVDLQLCCMDFSQTSSWDCCELISGLNRLVFVLGGTIGNVQERQFFEALKHLIKEHPDTTVVIGGQFFDSSEELISSKDEILGSYPEGAKELALSSVIDPLRKNFRDLSYNEFLDAVRKDFVSAEPARELKAMMNSDVPETMAVLFRLEFTPPRPIRLSSAKSGAQKALDLVVSRRYVRSKFQAHVSALLQSESEFVDHPSKKFSHLIVWPVRNSSGD